MPLNLRQKFLSSTRQPETWNDSSVKWDLYKTAQSQSICEHTDYCSSSWTSETRREEDDTQSQFPK